LDNFSTSSTNGLADLFWREYFWFSASLAFWSSNGSQTAMVTSASYLIFTETAALAAEALAKNEKVHFIVAGEGSESHSMVFSNENCRINDFRPPDVLAKGDMILVGIRRQRRQELCVPRSSYPCLASK
jgi:hypothetical protein